MRSIISTLDAPSSSMTFQYLRNRIDEVFRRLLIGIHQDLALVIHQFTRDSLADQELSNLAIGSFG